MEFSETEFSKLTQKEIERMSQEKPQEIREID